jgi:hypothetical protein
MFNFNIWYYTGINDATPSDKLLQI